MKNLKHFTRFKQRAALRKLFSPRPDKASYVAGTNILSRRYTGIYKHLLSQCFENAVLWCLKMVKCKCFFLTSNRNMFVRKFVKRVGFWLRCGSIFCTMLSELRLSNKWGFCLKLHCKINDIFCQFLLALRLSAKKSELKR